MKSFIDLVNSFEFFFDIPRIEIDERQNIETLIYEDVLFTKHLRCEKGGGFQDSPTTFLISSKRITPFVEYDLQRLRLTKALLEGRKFKANEKILDIGGHYSLYNSLCEAFSPATPFILNIDSKSLGNIKNAYLRDGIKTGFPDSSWDIVTCYDVIEHLDEPAEMIHECYRILKPKGLFIISSPNLASIYNRIALALGYTPFSYSATRYFVGSLINSRNGKDSK